MGSKSASSGSPIGGSASPSIGTSPQPAMPYGQQQFTPPNPQYPAMNPQYPSPSPQYPTAIPQRPYLNPQDANLRQLASGYRPSNQNLRQVAQQLRAQQPQPVLRPPMMYDPGPSQQPPSVINPPMMYDPGPQFNGGSSPVTHPQNPASPANVYTPQQQANRPVNVVHNMNWQRENNALPAPHPYVPRPQPINPNNPKAPPPGPDMPITTPGAPDMPGGGGLPLPGVAGLFSSGGTIGRPSWKKGGSVHSHDDIDNALRVAKLQFGGTPALRQGPTLQQSAVTPMTYDRAGYAFGGDAFASSTGSTASAPSASGAASTSGAPAATPSTPSSAGNAPQAGSQSQDSNSSPDNGTHVEAPMYLNMNNPMDNMMAQGQTGFARGGQVHMEEGGDPEAQQQETPDYDRASQFEQQQLQSGEPQVPQTNKEMEQATEYYGNKALNLGRAAAYLHPVTRGAMGVYDLAHGAMTGDPSEMATSMFAIPNRAAKAIAAAGMAHQPESEGADPRMKFIRAAYGMADGGEVEEALNIARKRHG